MKSKEDNSKLPHNKKVEEEEPDLNGYPLYPDSEDIYKKFIKGEDLNPEELSKTKENIKKPRARPGNEKDFEDDLSGSDLDIPGSELDDEQETIGNEDEENNYYSFPDDEDFDFPEEEDVE